MRVLVACEFSGVVRDAFIAEGHDAVSCDLLPTESPGPHHQGDVRDMLGGGWDLMIAHPPCTYLALAGVRWLYDHERFPNRWQQLIEGAAFFRSLLDAPIPHIAVENPGMHRWAAQIIGATPDQVIHPWMFGHMETKATWLWLRGLPPLMATEDGVAGRRTVAHPLRASRSRPWQTTQRHLRGDRHSDGRPVDACRRAGRMTTGGAVSGGRPSEVPKCCPLCGRWGNRQFRWDAGRELWVCSNDRACKGRMTTASHHGSGTSERSRK